MTVRELERYGQEALASGGAGDPRADSRILLAFVMDVPFSKLMLHYGDTPSDSTIEKYKELISRRAAGTPVQYITNEQEFMGLSFYVDERVLIPRLDTEILVEKALEYIKEENNPVKVLDLCCGSGAIGLSIAALAGESGEKSLLGDNAVIATSSEDSSDDFDGNKNMNPAVAVTLTDISGDALDVAEKNAAALGIKDKVTFAEGNLFDALKDPECSGNRFDLIVSNPPYVKSEVIPTLDTQVKDHEPMLALDGGADGLDIYKRIIKEAPEHLSEGGALMMEIGFDQADDLMKLVDEAGRYTAFEVIQDLAGLDRVIICRTGEIRSELEQAQKLYEETK